MAESKIKADKANTLTGIGDQPYLGANVISAIETSYQNATAYQLFSGRTATGIEGGWYGFKHAANAACFAMFFSKAVGIILLKREAGEEAVWNYVRLWGG